MPRPPGKCSADLQKEALQLVADFLSWEEYHFPLRAVESISTSHIDASTSTLEVIEKLSRMLEDYRPCFNSPLRDYSPSVLLLGVAASFFPEYYFKLSQNPGESASVIAMTENGPKTLYQVAKEVCEADKQELSCPEEYEDTLEGLLPDCTDEPYYLDVFQELLHERKTYVFGHCGFISRVALLFRDEPAFLRSLNAHLASSKMEVTILERSAGPSPTLINLEARQADEYVSKEGCQELLDRVDHHRSLWLQNCP